MREEGEWVWCCDCDSAGGELCRDVFVVPREGKCSWFLFFSHSLSFSLTHLSLVHFTSHPPLTSHSLTHSPLTHSLSTHLSQNAAVFERKLSPSFPSLTPSPAQFNPDHLAARRQREAEQSLTHSTSTSTSTPLPAVKVTVNSPQEHWVCPACAFSNPASAKTCVVCNTERGAVIKKVGRNSRGLWKGRKGGHFRRR